MLSALKKLIFLFVISIGSFSFLHRKLEKSETTSNPLETLCGRLPQNQDISFDNKIWQLFHLQNRTYYLHNAYFDDRFNKTVVRLGALGDKLNNLTDNIFCQIWHDETPDAVPIVVKASHFIKLWPDTFYFVDGMKLPYLITCPIDLGNQTPVAVSLTTKACENAENKLTIINNQPIDGVKKSFGVCCRFVRVEDKNMTMRFIEWVELLRILGVHKITLYKQHVHEDFLNVLNHYRDKGSVDYFDYLEPSVFLTLDQSNKDRQKEVIETLFLTDCFYKTKNLFYLHAVLDIDEVIVPRKPEDYTWYHLLKDINFLKNYTGFLPLHSVLMKPDFPPDPDIPEHFHMLRHTTRTEAQYLWSKPIFVPDPVLAVYLHFPLWCYDGDNFDTFCTTQRPMPEETVLLYHFTDEMNKFDVFKNVSTLSDKTLLKYKDDLMREVTRTLSEKKFEP